MDFTQETARFLETVKRDMAKDFDFREDAMVSGRWVALEARFDLDGERKPLGLIPTGFFTHSHELCLFIPAETLDGAALTALCDYITRVHDETVQADALHEFSMFSLVVLTRGFDRALAKTLRRFEHEVQYQEPRHGWASTRVAVVDLEGLRVAANKRGDPLASRLAPTVKALRAARR